MKPDRYIWFDGPTHETVTGKEYDAVWDYAEQLEDRLSWERHCVATLKAENEAVRKYAQHYPDCIVGADNCKCGLVALLKGEDDAEAN